MKQLRWLVVVVSLAFLFAGCSKPPEAEQQGAKSVMDAAISAGADKYAAADLDAAKKKLDEAEGYMKEKKYKEAKQAYIDAKGAFEKAEAGVDAGKKALADEANSALATTEEQWGKLEAQAKQEARRMEKNQQDKEAWNNDSKAISEGMAKVKGMIATDPVGAKAKLEELKGLMNNWDNRFEEMAGAAQKPKQK